jgi:hypothetical protein
VWRFLASEAKTIARKLKAELARQPADHSGVRPTKEEFAQDFGYHRPCVFLRDGECSIYDHCLWLAASTSTWTSAPYCASCIRVMSSKYPGHDSFHRANVLGSMGILRSDA